MFSVSKLFRHGDKVPHREYQNYPNDPYRDHSYYPMGDGDLTNVSSNYDNRYEILRRVIRRVHWFCYIIAFSLFRQCHRVYETSIIYAMRCNTFERQ